MLGFIAYIADGKLQSLLFANVTEWSDGEFDSDPEL